MSLQQLEQILCQNCAPVLMGVKPSNLVSFSKEQSRVLQEDPMGYICQLQRFGIRMKVLCDCKKHDLVLFYREELLSQYTQRTWIRAFLETFGYDRDASLSQQLDHLQNRYHRGEEFPHEIGIFLGYPLEDVLGFLHHTRKSCKFCGYWKVYGNVQSARETFRQYDESKVYLQQEKAKGRTLLQILDAGNRQAAVLPMIHKNHEGDKIFCPQAYQQRSGETLILQQA